jgi:hypothetical protein
VQSQPQNLLTPHINPLFRLGYSKTSMVWYWTFLQPMACPRIEWAKVASEREPREYRGAT